MAIQHRHYPIAGVQFHPESIVTEFGHYILKNFLEKHYVTYGLLNIVVALACEARFFLDRYRLSRLNQINAYPVYANVERNIYLIVSGVGKIKSAAALSFLHGY